MQQFRDYIEQGIFRLIIELCPKLTMVKMLEYDGIRIAIRRNKYYSGVDILGIDFRERVVNWWIRFVRLNYSLDEIKDALYKAVEKVVDGDYTEYEYRVDGSGWDAPQICSGVEVGVWV